MGSGFSYYVSESLDIKINTQFSNLSAEENRRRYTKLQKLLIEYWGDNPNKWNGSSRSLILDLAEFFECVNDGSDDGRYRLPNYISTRVNRAMNVFGISNSQLRHIKSCRDANSILAVI